MKTITSIVSGVVLASAIGVAQAADVPDILGDVDAYQPMSSQEMAGVQGEWALALGSAGAGAGGPFGAATISYTNNNATSGLVFFPGVGFIGNVATSYAASGAVAW